MKDFATSESPAVQAQLDRLAALTLPQGRFGLEAIIKMLERLGNPQKHLPPVFHVAGTNGKGSTCTYLRMILEAEGLTVHSATKPHLVRYNERIRLAGQLIKDQMLADLLKEVLDTCEDLHPSFFEVTTAAIFLAFSRVPADVCVIEVGLGGRFDATNVLEHPSACGIATLGIDHEAFLLRPEEGTPENPLARIAFEKAGIARPGVPLVTQSYPEEARLEVERIAGIAGSSLHMRNQDWWADIGETIEYRDRFGALNLPLPPLMPGVHQADNAALAVAMLRHQDRVSVDTASITKGICAARWPARLQKLGSGPLTQNAGAREVWLDGGHNPDAGQAIARHFNDQPLHLVIGMLENKDPQALIEPLDGALLSLTVVPIEGSPHHPVEAFGHAAKFAPNVTSALANLPADGVPVLIGGSLYLAGKVLKANGELPD